MKKKLLVVVLVLISVFILYKVSYKLYTNYRFKKIQEDYELNSFKLKRLIFNNAEKEIKFNDLIFVCELRKGLWDSGIGVDKIQAASENNSQQYKRFIENVRADIQSDTELSEFAGRDKTEINSEIMARLCTLVDPETKSSRSLYNELLWKKYKETGNSIGDVSKAEISDEDFKEYSKAIDAEKELRMKL